MATYINVDDEEQAASAIVEGLQRMLTAEREAHGAVKETCARLKRQLERLPTAQALRSREELARAEAEQLLQQQQQLLQQRERLEQELANERSELKRCKDKVEKQREELDTLRAKLEIKTAKRAALAEESVRKCVQLLVDRTARTAAKEDRYPPGEWDFANGRPVDHAHCFVNSDRYQMGHRDYVGVNIDHSVTTEDGKKRQNHQVYFTSVEAAQEYYKSLPKIPKPVDDARDAAKRERDLARQERDALRQERDLARQERDLARRELDLARQERDLARREREMKIKECEEAKRECATANWRLEEIVRVAVTVGQLGPGKWKAMAADLFGGGRTGSAVAELYRAMIEPHIGTDASRKRKGRAIPEGEGKKARARRGPPRVSLFNGVTWDRADEVWVARCGDTKVQARTELEAAIEYDKMASSGRTNFLTIDETERGHVRVMADGMKGTFAIYAHSSGPDVAPVQLPRDVLGDHAWHFTSELPLAERMRFHAPGLPDRLGRRVRIDGLMVTTASGPRFVRFHGFIESDCTMDVSSVM